MKVTTTVGNDTVGTDTFGTDTSISAIVETKKLPSKKRPSPAPWISKSTLKKSKPPPLPLDWTNQKRCLPSSTFLPPTISSSPLHPLSGPLTILKLDSQPWHHCVFKSSNLLLTPKYNCCEDCGDGSYCEYYVERYGKGKEKICLGSCTVTGGDGMSFSGCIRGSFVQIQSLEEGWEEIRRGFRGWLKRKEVGGKGEVGKLGEGVLVRLPFASVRKINKFAASGFADAKLYDSTRPSYPAEVVDKIASLAQNSTAPGPPTIVELGAGTGLFTSLLSRSPSLPSHTQYYANEISPPFLSHLSSLSLPIKIIGGSASTIDGVEISSNVADIVVCAQSFHWFVPYPAAYMEARRILKKDGLLCLLWNERDTSIKWIKDLEDEIIGPLYEEFEEDVPRQQSKKWEDTFEHFLGNYYGNLHRVDYDKSVVHEGGEEMIVGRILSLSVVSGRSEEDRIAVEKNVRRWLRNRDDIDLKNEKMTYRTELYYTRVIA
ncbi:hypothetical protein TrST_g7737 [Triparma strigata]|uniref:Methyltransferase type 11 domain-containing protein n=1 Tax=Triparma strigata TaxID=1606541 RepID=A0A9W6ZNP7_9STRA|nr:hypothetical protein TrST_g7737 [Triparma strigata]